MSGAVPGCNPPIRFHKTLTPVIDAMTAVTAMSFSRHTHDQYGIGTIDQGGHASLSDSGKVEARPGDLILVNPGEVHDGRPLDSRGRAWRMLYFEPGWIHELQADITQGEDSRFALLAPVLRDPHIRNLFDAAFHCATRDESDLAGMALDTAALALIARLVKELGHRRTIGQWCPTALAKARDLIESDPAQSFSLASLACISGMSRFQLHRGFLRETGLSPHLYVLQRRIELARRLLKAGHPPAQAALAAGFCDQSHLNRAFLRHLGITPARYVHGA